MNRSYRKEILDVLKQQGKYTDINKIDFNWLADKVGIKVAKVETEFIDIDDVFYHASIEYWGDHEKKSQKILQLKGEDALATLIRHDLSNVYLYLRDTPSSEIELPRNKTVLFVKDYIEKGMSKNYFDLLRLNPELRPDKNLDIRLYAHFIVHSLFFDAEKIKSLSQEEFKAQSRRLIIALFKPKTTMA